MTKKSKNNKVNTNKQKSIVIPKKFLEKYLIKLEDASNIRGRRNQFQQIKPERADAVNLTLRVAHNLPENVNVDSKVAQLRIKDKWNNSFSNPANAYLDYKANESYYNKRAKNYAAKKKKEEKFRANYMNGSLFPDRTFVHASPVKFGLFDYRYFGQNTDNGYYGKGFYFHPPTAYLLSINRFTHPNSYGDEIYNMAARINNPFFPKSMSDAFYNGNVHLFNREGASEALNSFDSVLTLPPQFMFHEGLSATNPELIIKNINDVKSILGNNGNFSIFSDGFYYKNGGRINNGKE